MNPSIPNDSFHDCVELVGKPYPISDVALTIYKIQSMLRQLESKIVLLTLIEFLYNKSINLDFSEEGRHKIFEPDLITNKIVSFNGDSFEIDTIFAATLCEIEMQNKLHQKLRDNIFQRKKFDTKIVLNLKYYNSSTKTYEVEEGDLPDFGNFLGISEASGDTDFDYSLKIFQFLKTL